jgi:hypothetical protein
MEPIIRYFEAKKEHVNINKYRTMIMPDTDYLPLDEIRNAVVIAEIDDKYILKIWLGTPTIAELQTQTECADPLSLEAVSVLDITQAYIGTEIADVILRYSELAGNYIVGQDEEGNNIMAPKIREIN